MEQDVLGEIKKESESLYYTVIQVAKKKWNVLSFEKAAADLCYIRVSKVKKPDVEMKVKCLLHNSRWFLVGEK